MPPFPRLTRLRDAGFGGPQVAPPQRPASNARGIDCRAADIYRETSLIHAAGDVNGPRAAPSRVQRTERPLRLGQTLADREAHEVGPRLDAEFLHHAVLVAVDGLDAAGKFGRNLGA